MNKLMIAMAVAALVSGCGTMRSALNPLPTFQASIKGTHLDVSTGDETALIVGVNKFWTDCTIRGPVPVKPGDGTLNTPLSNPNSLVVDAGPATIEVACTTTDIFNDLHHYKARFKFAAEAGHTYTIGRTTDCMELLDATAGGRVLACKPYYSGIYNDLSTGNDTAKIIAGGALSDKGNCKPSTGGWRGRSDFLEVDAGPVAIEGECRARILPDFLGRRRRLSSFHFVAEAGHTYTITAIDKECMSLLDISFEEIVIACEPYQKSQ